MGREKGRDRRSVRRIEGLVQARPLRGDQEAGAALDNQHAEMVRSFHPPFPFYSRLRKKEAPRPRASWAASWGCAFSPVLRREVEGEGGQ